MAETLEEWAYYMLDDFITETGYPLVQTWQEQYGTLPPGRRLVPVIPFILGGRFSLENLRPLDTAEGMRQHAMVAQQVCNLPDGADVRVIIAP
ncbi:MAG: SMI1/KNR4 family protein [Chloroflexi bacterium AL-W]|nr:SMI1/KNR4 family protein [Chloroflexi bacterium AL-N1]NOK69453.1 SMI1/KNR4 family protein [Chloroflexi bacterium AL-N10]NOK77418.1 SMI1/KNR4 family protein [Chloroflexi bacterium AL-N5]NOK84269.1 SMI1/KNR4 family protein [Chloroflexi bacterium AL-W]NOK91566.1 SMI1/KNR4 family protein [Chloroflexi bacterium AL-N15]